MCYCDSLLRQSCDFYCDKLCASQPLSQLLKILAFDRKVTECAEAGGWAISSTRKKDKAVCLYQFINEKLKLRDVKMHEERDNPDPGRTDKKYQIRFGERLASRITWQPKTGWAVVIGLVAATGLLALTSVSEFLYFQF